MTHTTIDKELLQKIKHRLYEPNIFTKKTKETIHKQTATIVSIISKIVAKDYLDVVSIYEKEYPQVRKGLKKLDDMAMDDIKDLENIYKKQINDVNKFYSTFTEITRLFEYYAESSLSKYQISVFPRLRTLLQAIYETEYLKTMMPFISVCSGGYGIYNPKMMERLMYFQSFLKSRFWELYQQVSNDKSFDFERWNNDFRKFKSMKYDDFDTYFKLRVKKYKPQ